MQEFTSIQSIIRANLHSNLPNFTLEDAIRSACREFCQRTLVMQEDVIINLVQDEQQYAIEPSTPDSMVIKVLSVRNEQNHSLVAVDKLPITNQTGRPTHYTNTRPNQLVLHPKPISQYDDSKLTLTISIKPSLSATTADNAFLEQYADALRDGALYYLKKQPNTDWYAPDEVAMYRELFDKHMSDALFDMSTGFNTGESTVEMRAF